MKKFLLSIALFAGMLRALSAAEPQPLWPGNAPDESAQITHVDDLDVPCWIYSPPAEKKTDACLIICPGGAYYCLAYVHEGIQIADYFNSKGMTVVTLHYRVPRREGKPKHLPAWQDAQRMVRVVRSHAQEWGIDPNKIGVMGFSAGGHLALMTATTSMTPAYEPVDELDRTVPCNVNFAVPVYPAYVLTDGRDEGGNANKGLGASLVEEFAFDANTPPICFIHGDDDIDSSMGSVAVYQKLKSMGIPGEVHIFAKVEHGFGGSVSGDHVGDWLNRVYAWLKAMEIY